MIGKLSAAPGISWPTSDDPVICLNYYGKDNYDFGGGWGKKGCEIIFPISPNKVLYTQIGEEITINQFDTSLSRLVEKLIIEHAHRKIYSISPNDKVRSIRDKIENSTVYKEEMKEFDNWNSGYMGSERKNICNIQNLYWIKISYTLLSNFPPGGCFYLAEK